MEQAIIVIGGYNSLWPAYLRMARDLEDLSGLQAVGVPLMPWHWQSATRKGDATGILEKLAATTLWARRRFKTDRFILVGHSAGGLIARLYLSDRPVWGHLYPGLDHVTMLVTLGSPHCSASRPGWSQGSSTNWFLVDTPNRVVPGATYADRVRYWTVAGRWIQGRPSGTRREQRAFQMYRGFNGYDGGVWGDGIVPVDCAHLSGADTLVLDGVAHSARSGRAWYGGSKPTIRRWWSAVEPHVD
jgi:pimeloyl-ACP methyl ester carboxylesterase